MASQADLARNFIKTALKAKKLLQIYPANNIIYRNVIDEIFSIAEEYLDTYGDLIFRITPAEMFVDSESVYQSSGQGPDRTAGRKDDLALMFFNEGIREVTFKTGLHKNELEEFLKLTGKDFDRDEEGADLVSALWEKGLEGIKITLDESVFFEGDDQPAGATADSGEGTAGAGGVGTADMEGTDTGPGVLFLSGVNSQEEDSTDDASQGEDGKLLAAYNDALGMDEVSPSAPADLTADERGFILAETKAGISESNKRLAEILVEMLPRSRDESEAAAIAKSLKDLIIYSFRGNDLESVITALRGTKSVSRESVADEGGIVDAWIYSCNVSDFCGSTAVMEQLGRMIDSTKEISEETLLEYARLLGNGAIGPFISLLDTLQNISARRMVNNVLIQVGKEDLNALAAGLNDPTWYVVRNIIYVLRNIGDNSVEDAVIAIAHHEHPRVRLEVVKALNKFGSLKALQALREFLDDSDSTVRLSAIAIVGKAAKDIPAFGPFAKGLIFSRIKDGSFDVRDFREKKSFCEALAALHDGEADQYMVGLLKKRSLFGGRKNSEARACAAYYLGLAGCREALAPLEKLRNASDPLLREHIATALQRINNE